MAFELYSFKIKDQILKISVGNEMANSKPMSAFFAENLNAPLVNVQWSWGAENDNGVYLRIWAQEVKDKKGFIYFNSAADRRLGQKERLRHIKLINQGKPGYVVVITNGHESKSRTWRIDSYEECVYRILSIDSNSNGDFFATIDNDNPIYPMFIGQEIDTDNIINAAAKVPTSAATLDRAMLRFGWRPTGICPDRETINLISRDGRQTARLLISSGQWIR